MSVNGADAGKGQQVTLIQVAYNHATCLVSLGIQDVPVALAQMMLDEAVRQLDLLRRQAAAMDLRQRLADQALVESISGKSHGAR